MRAAATRLAMAVAATDCGPGCSGPSSGLRPDGEARRAAADRSRPACATRDRGRRPGQGYRQADRGRDRPGHDQHGGARRKTDRDGQVRIILFRHGSLDSSTSTSGPRVTSSSGTTSRRTTPGIPRSPPRSPSSCCPGEQTLGGTVVDEQGRPIKGVKVVIWGYLGEKKRKEELAYMVDATTDERGRWRCRCFRDMQFAYLYLSHPDYLADGDRHPACTAGPPRRTRPAGRDADGGSPRLLRRAGHDPRGRDRRRGPRRTGEAIQDAEVGWLEEDKHHTFHEDMPTTTTDAQGRFRFRMPAPAGWCSRSRRRGTRRS